jgi:hypothetical protein
MQPRADGIFRLHQVYTSADPHYTGKVTVPTLWDRQRRTIVNHLRHQTDGLGFLHGNRAARQDKLKSPAFASSGVLPTHHAARARTLASSGSVGASAFAPP